MRLASARFGSNSVHRLLSIIVQYLIFTNLDMTVVHKDSLEVGESGTLEHFLAQPPDVISAHPQDLDVMVQVGRDSIEAGVGAVRLPLAIGPLARAGLGTLVREVARLAEGQGQRQEGPEQQLQAAPGWRKAGQ